jgi:hypothetical protein
VFNDPKQKNILIRFKFNCSDLSFAFRRKNKMKEIIRDLPVRIKAGETFEIYLKDIFCITDSMFTLTPSIASGIAMFKISNVKNNSIGLDAIVRVNQTLNLAYKVDNSLFDSAIEEFHVLEITPENELKGVFSWSKDCSSELLSIYAR